MHACMHACMYVWMYCIVMYCNAMQWNGMEWNVCMYVYSTYTHIIPYRLSFFSQRRFWSHPFPAEFARSRTWIQVTRSTSVSVTNGFCSMEIMEICSVEDGMIHEWYMNDMWMIHEYINYINHNIEILRYMMCTTEVCKLRSPVPSLGNSAPAFPTWNALSKKCICRRSRRSFSSFTRLRILEVYLSCSGPK